MGEVYRARDAKLNRDVAAIYGFEDSGATHALVLELVDGPTLQTGRKEVWVRPFASGLDQWQISPDASTFGGDWPRWNRTPKTTEVFYHSITTSFRGGLYAQPDGFQGPIFSVALKAGADTIEAASPQEVIRAMAVRLAHGSDYHTYGVSPDAKRFLVMQRVITTDAATGAILTELPVPGLTVALSERGHAEPRGAPDFGYGPFVECEGHFYHIDAMTNSTRIVLPRRLSVQYAAEPAC